MCDASLSVRVRWRGLAGCVAVALVLAVVGCSGPDDASPDLDATTTTTATVTAPPTVPPVFATAPPISASPAPDGRACAVGVDILGFSDALDKTTIDDIPVANLSAIAWAGADRYIALSDRDGIVYRIEFPLDGTPRAMSAFRITDATGEPYGEDQIDGEGLALDGDDLLVASEVGPSISRYGSDGRLVASLTFPSRFLVAPAGQGALNETFESLALAPDRQVLWTANERPLASDGIDADGRGRVRLLRYQRDGDSFIPSAEYLYLTEPDQGLVELIDLGGGELLALERGLSLMEGFSARIYRVQIDGATDIAAADAADGAIAVTKTPLVDLADCPVTPDGGPPGPFSPLLDNFEGMTLGPELPGGRRSLILISDDNSQSLQVTRVVVLSITP